MDEYLEFCFRKKLVFNADQRKFEDCSKSLERKCVIYINKEILTKVPIFQYLNEEELLAICKKLKQRIYMPNEVCLE